MQVARQYFSVFLATMLREWGRIDKLRLDKFMMLVRCFFNELFLCVAAHAWCAPVQVTICARLVTVFTSSRQKD